MYLPSAHSREGLVPHLLEARSGARPSQDDTLFSGQPHSMTDPRRGRLLSDMTPEGLMGSAKALFETAFFFRIRRHLLKIVFLTICHFSTSGCQCTHG